MNKEEKSGVLSERSGYLLASLQQFESFGGLSSEDQRLAVKNLAASLDSYGTEKPSHAAAIDAHRELLSLIRDQKSLLACEALLRLLISEQRIEIDDPNETFSECIQLLQHGLLQNTEPSKVALICTLLDLCRTSVVDVKPEELRVNKLFDACAEYFGTIPSGGLGEDARKNQEVACWRTLLCIFRSIPSGEIGNERRNSLATVLMEVGEKRFVEFPAGMTTMVVERFDSERVSIDIFSAVVLSCIQSCTLQADRIQFAANIVRELIARCVRASGIDDRGKGKALYAWIRQLTQDSLAVLRAPEWPVAELVLSILLQEIQVDNGLLNSNKAGPQALGVELLGSIAVKMEKDVRARKTAWAPPPDEVKLDATAASARPTDKNEIVACPCGEPANRLMIDCSRCHRWFHANCLGFDEMDSNLTQKSKDFRCSDCSVVDELEDSERVKQEQIMLTPTRSKLSKEPTSTSSSPSRVAVDPIAKRQRLVRDHLRFQFGRTKNELFLTAMRCFADEEADKVELEEEVNEAALASQVKTCLTREGASRLARIVAHEQTRDDYRLNDQRDRMLGIILNVMNHASRPAARAEAMEALGRLLDVNKELMNNANLVASVKVKAEDPSIKVREACLQHIISKLETNSPGVEYLEMIIQRMEDTGASVRKRAVELACKYLGSSRGGEILTRLSVRLEDSTELSVREMIRKSFFHFLKTESPEQIVNSLGAVDRPDALVILIKLPLEEIANSKSKQPSKSPLSASNSGEVSYRLLERLVGTVVNKIFSKDQPLVRLRLLKAFCKADPSLVAPHIRLLVPLLSPDPKPDPEQAMEICEMLAMSDLSLLDPDAKQVLSRNLLKLITGNHAMVMPQSVRALEQLCLVDPSIKLLDELAKQFLGSLTDQTILSKLKPDNIQRALYGLGLIARYHPSLDKSMLKLMASALSRFASTKQTPIEVRKRAIQAVGLFLVAYPDDRLMKYCLSSVLKESPPEGVLCERALLGFVDMLTGASELGDDSTESRLESMVLSELGEVKKQMLNSEDEMCRKAACRVIQCLLDRGKIHPEQCYRELFALERDPECHSLAHSILLAEMKKKTAFNELHLYEGILLSVKVANPNKDNPTCFVESYSDLLSELSVSSRYQFLKRLADVPFKTTLPLKEVAFICKVIASLPFQKQMEVQYLLQKLRNQAELRSNEARAVLDPLLGPVLKAIHAGRTVDMTNDVTDERVLDQAKKCLSISMAFDLYSFLKREYKVTVKGEISIPTEKDEKASPDVSVEKLNEYVPTFPIDDTFSPKPLFLADKLLRTLIVTSKTAASEKDAPNEPNSKARWKSNKDDEDADPEDLVQVRRASSSALDMKKSKKKTRDEGSDNDDEASPRWSTNGNSEAHLRLNRVVSSSSMDTKKSKRMTKKDDDEGESDSESSSKRPNGDEDPFRLKRASSSSSTMETAKSKKKKKKAMDNDDGEDAQPSVTSSPTSPGPRSRQPPPKSDRLSKKNKIDYSALNGVSPSMSE